MTSKKFARYKRCAKAVLTVVALSAQSTISYSQSVEQLVEDLPTSMGALGDSMTAGALAGLRRQDANYPWVQIQIIARLADFAFSKKLAAVEYRDLSWTTGLNENHKVLSHARKLAGLLGVDSIPLYNAAISGEESKHIAAQLEVLEDWSHKNLGQNVPDYVTLLIGANDICQDTAEQMVDERTYYSNVVATIDEIQRQNPKTKVLISSLPNIDALHNIAIDQPLFVGTTCKDIWKTIKLCHTLTLEDNPVERQKIAQRVLQYNTALQNIAQDRGANGKVKFAKSIYDVKFTANDISVDCFHPNPHGQQMLSDASFSDGFWGDDWEKNKNVVQARWQIEKSYKDCVQYNRMKAPRAPARSCQKPDWMS